MREPSSGHAGPSGKANATGVFLQSRLILGGLLIVAVLLLYNPVVHHKFVNFDDNNYVTANAHVQSGLTLQNVAWAFSTIEASNWHPLTWLSHMADCQLFGLNPTGHHYTNVLLHTINALLLFLLLARATGSLWRSLLVAALFAVHPLNVENVAWVAERKSLLSALFSLLTVAAYGWYAKAPNWKRYLTVVVGLALALLSKPMAVTLPIVLLLLDYWPLRRLDAPGTSALGFGWTQSEGLPIRIFKLSLDKAPLFVMSVASAWITVVAQRAGGAVAVTDVWPLSMRLKCAAVSYVQYLQKAFWPSRLAVFYPQQPSSLVAWKVGIALAILSGVSWLAYRFRRERYLPMGWCFFLVTLIPVIGIVQVGAQSMADRYAYIPLMGIFILVVWGVTRLADRLAIHSMVRVVAALGVLIALAAVAHTTLGYWQDSLTLFRRAAQIAGAPSPIIEGNLAEALAVAGRDNEAFQHFQLAARYAPESPLPHYNLGMFLLFHGLPREAIPEFQTALRLSNSRRVTEPGLSNLAVANLEVGNYEEAERDFTAVLQFDGNRYLAVLGRGQALYRQGKYQEAADDFSRAVTMNPDAGVFLWLGKSLEGQKKIEMARAAYGEALKRDPNLTEAQARLGSLEMQHKP
jgi:tetratricopeptide (TPR) repeat protein